MPEPKKGHRLTDMEYDEVSLVTRGANQDAKVVLFKSDIDTADDGSDSLGQQDSTTKETNPMPERKAGKANEIKKVGDGVDLSKLDPEVKAAVEAEFAKANETQAELLGDAEEMAEVIDELLALDEEDDEEDDDVDHSVIIPDGDDVEKIDLSKLDAPVAALISKFQADAAQAQADALEAMEIAKAEQDRRELGEHVELAKSLTSSIAADNDELGAALMDIRKNCSDDTFKAVEEVIRGANEISKSSPIFKENGHTVPLPNTAAAKIDAKVAEITKLDPTIDRATALATVLAGDSELYSEYVAENRK